MILIKSCVENMNENILYAYQIKMKEMISWWNCFPYTGIPQPLTMKYLSQNITKLLV